MNSLFVYGTLGPGRPNAHILEDIGGTWQNGHVKGFLKNKGWGAGMGYPGIILDNAGENISGFLFFSENIVNHWETLDIFEGSEYERVAVEVFTEQDEKVRSWIYVLKK